MRLITFPEHSRRIETVPPYFRWTWKLGTSVTLPIKRNTHQSLLLVPRALKLSSWPLTYRQRIMFYKRYWCFYITKTLSWNLLISIIAYTTEDKCIIVSFTDIVHAPFIRMMILSCILKCSRLTMNWHHYKRIYLKIKSLLNIIGPGMAV